MWTESGLPGAAVVGYFALLGAVIGSFLNVCILRWGAEPKQSVMFPPSRCPTCGRPIRWYENVPIVSWLYLRGRCSGCGAGISPMYPAIEATTAVLWGGSLALLGLGLPALELAVASTLLLGIAVSDARAFIIPHEFSLGGTAIALAFAAWPEPAGALDAMRGALFGAGLVLLVGEVTELVLGQEAMGGGDCALMGMVGAFFGWQAVWPVLALGAFIGIVLHLAVTLRRRAPAEQQSADAPPGLRWGRLIRLLAGGLALGVLMGVTARMGVLGGVLRAIFYAVVGAGAAYYASFFLPRRTLGGPLTQVWGLIGAGVGIAVGTGGWAGIFGGLALGGGALAWASRQTVTASPASTDELSAHGYLPFGVGLSLAAAVLAFSGGFERVREIFVEIAPGLGL
ncbi:MAG: prepilin peptidase [Gemmatimonadales bacterium]|nr:prepilin peptidase [Gemmatimonadales bacterium]